MEKNYAKRISFLSLFVWLLMQSGYSQNFTVDLPIPDTIDSPLIELVGDTLFHNFIPAYAGQDSFNHVRTFAYNQKGRTSNTFLGPTLIWRPGRYQNIEVLNTLGTSTTVHWHGAHIPARWDGGPHQEIPSGTTWKPNFNILEAPATMWYHPHYAEHTFSQVEMGLAGIVIIEDPANDTNYARLPHTYGFDDIPVIIQDRQFQKISGTTRDYEIDTVKNKTLPRYNVVNGYIAPKLQVAPQRVRFRILDGSSRNTYNISVYDSTTRSDIPFTVIASDAGYLQNPAVETQYLIGPGIRAEIVVDFGAVNANHEIYLKNNPINSIKWPGNFVDDAPTGMMMKIEITKPIDSPVGPVPPVLTVRDTFPGHVNRERLIILTGASGIPGPQINFGINGNQFIINVVNDTILLDSIEEWTIYNASTVAHPFHIHDIHFFVVDVDSHGVAIPENRWPIEFLGPKDNVMVPVEYKVTFRTKFADFATDSYSADSAYMYHCHILTHEDGLYVGANHDSVGMMQQFVVVPISFHTHAQEQEMGEDMVLYPNPATDMLNLKGKSAKASSIRIYDLAGKLLSESELAPFNGEVQIPIEQLPAGIILVEWRTTKGSYTRKIIIRKD